mgnify:CR=1 FL=1
MHDRRDGIARGALAPVLEGAIPCMLPASMIDAWLVEAELASFARVLRDPERPYAVVLGGAKVSDKLAVIGHLLERAPPLPRRHPAPCRTPVPA